MKRTPIIAGTLLLGMWFVLVSCAPVPASVSQHTTTPTIQHSTIQPEGKEATFELKPNSSCSVIAYLGKGQRLKVHYLFSPSDLGGQVITVEYTYPEGNVVAVSDVGAGGEPRRSFETMSGHDEGYYSIDFYYIVRGGADIKTFSPVQIYVRYDILQ